MTDESSKQDPRPDGLDRRRFLTGAAAGVALAATAPAARGQGETPAPAAGTPAPTQAQLARDAGDATPPLVFQNVERPGSDLMVDVLRDLGIEYVASNPGSSFEGLQESIVNYGTPPNRMPEFITALHEETSVDMANGYGKAEGRPMCALLHGTIGLQHAAMAIYQAYYSGTPMLLIAARHDEFIQAHTADDMAGIVRSYTKWDSHPRTLADSLTALQEAYRQAITPPTGPALVILDLQPQKQEAGNLQAPRYTPPNIEGVDPGLAQDIARDLLNATNPRIEVGPLRTPEGVRLAVELAELVGASTSTAATQGPMSFPQTHPLCGPGASTDYDYVLALESTSQRAQVCLVRPNIASIAASRDAEGIGFGGLRDGDRRGQANNVHVIDAEASLPVILEAAHGLMNGTQGRMAEERRARHATANRQARLAALEIAVDERRVGWNASPISTARIYAELWPLIRNEDWCLASPSNFSGAHHRALWDHDKPYSYLGGQGAAGMGYGAGACGGAALAARERGRIVINIQTDGDLNYTPGVLWSAVHHKLPMLTIMHNNRGYHQEVMFLAHIAAARSRATERMHIGTTIRDPFIDYAKMADAYGMAGEGPIEDPSRLQAALRRGVDSVKRGEPYMIDLITQPR